jgi:hypothetical protein
LLREVRHENHVAFIEQARNAGDVLHRQIWKIAHADHHAARPTAAEVPECLVDDIGKPSGIDRISERNDTEPFGVLPCVHRIADDGDLVDDGGLSKDKDDMLEELASQACSFWCRKHSGKPGLTPLETLDWN